MERQFPKNVRQIGNVCDEPKIYVEDYVDTYLSQLRARAVDTPMAAALTGEIAVQEEQPVVYISGALQIKEIEVKGTEILISDSTKKEIEEKQKEYFAEQEVVGWCLIETGHPMSLNREIKKVHDKLLSKENSIFIWKDTTENEEIFFSYKYGDLMQMGGHYIYYERNPAMQNYMINTRKQNGVTPSEMVEDRAAKDFRSAIREKMEDKEQRQNSKMLYVTSVLLVIIVLAIGISTMNNYDKMESVQNTLESLSRSVNGSEEARASAEQTELRDKTGNESAEDMEVSDGEEAEVSAEKAAETSAVQNNLGAEDFYVVKKGDTLDSISIELYGDREHVEAICKMNGLSDGNLIFIGQKLLLP